MDDALQCENCGMWIHCFIRYCPACGNPVFTSLDPANARPELFFELMTSLYNLAANRENDERKRYIHPISEDGLIRRCSIDFKDELQALSLDYGYEDDWPEEIEDLFAMCLSSTLSGYVFRSVEEFITNCRSPEISPEKKEHIWSVLHSMEETIKKSSYRLLDPGDDLDRRVLFCIALLTCDGHLEHLLVTDKQHDHWFASIIEQSTERAIEFFQIAFAVLRPGESVPELIAEKRDFIRENVERGFLFGYAMKLSESLVPYKLQAASRPVH